MTSHAKLTPYTVFFNSSAEYHHLKQEIFTQDSYYFETANPAPVIIDAGAHIGMATLYFKKLYPGAHITAIEPLPQNFALLEKNIWENQLTEVRTHNVALAPREGASDIYFDATPNNWYISAGFTKGGWTHEQESDVIQVPTLPLADFLTEPIDFLKMDIEGAEEAVLTAAQDHLKMIRHAMIEFHPGAQQKLTRVVELFTERGFTVTLWQKGKIIQKSQGGLVLIEATQRTER